MTIEQEEKINNLISEFAKDADVISFVQKTEARAPITKGHYGDYMNFMSPYAESASSLYVISKALMMAGANQFGVTSAISILKGGN